MTPIGKGMFVWKTNYCEGGDPTLITQAAKDAGLSHVLIKIADGPGSYNTISAPPIIKALHAAGIQAWGWHYVYGTNPVAEAQIGSNQVKTLRMDGYVIDAEGEYVTAGPAAATVYMKELRGGIGTIPIALSTFRWPSKHADFPYQAFYDRGIDVSMPQVYWVDDPNAGAELIRSHKEYLDRWPSVPFVPTGAAYHEDGWEPKPAEIIEFSNTAKALGITAINFWEWGNSKIYKLWDTVAALDWGHNSNPITPPHTEQTNKLAKTLFNINVRNGANVGAQYMGVIPGGITVLVLQTRTVGNDVWAQLGTNLWCAMNYNGCAFLEVVSSA